jgi:cathepsin B
MRGTYQGRENDPNPLPFADIVPAQTIPASFDSRTQWPGCIGDILNQGECGSCWAFGTCETLSDRFCIHSNGSVVVSLSELDLLACDTNDDGCDGGWPSTAWLFAQKSGLVTNECIPYNETIPTCPPAQQPCLNFVNTPPCPTKCSSGQDWKSLLHYAASSYAVSQKVTDIQTEMMTNGPVQATFSVYEDFLSYKTGVYKHLTGQYVGGHSVKIIGWGELNSEAYWMVQNSWTDTWGDDGYFMILRGVDECGIESAIVAGLPKL